MFTVLVGHPGIGKGRGINPAVGILRETGIANILSDNLTIQYILEALSKGFAQATQTAGGGVSFGMDTSCFISAPELEVFLKASDAAPALKELWECKDGPFEYGTRGKGLYKVHKPCPSLLGGITPGQITKLMADEAISGGFTRRINFVYADKTSVRIPWPSINGGSKHLDDLVEDLRQISSLRGEVKFTEDAKKLFEIIYHESFDVDEFQDEATLAYVTSKWAHAAKLAMVLSVSRSDSLVIEKEDMALAIAAVSQAAEDLKKVFRTIGDSDMVVVADKVLRYIEMKGYASRPDILHALWRDVGTSANLDVILATLESGNIIASRTDKNNHTVWRALPRQVSQKGVGQP